MKQLSLACVLVSLATVAGCGGGGDDTSANPRPADQSSQGTASKVVPHERLVEILPTMDGWTKQTPQGSTDAAENVSRVQVDYEPAGADKASRLSVEIMDTMKNPNILAPLTDFIRANQTTQLGAGDVIGTTSPVEVSGYKGMQEWTPGAKNGTLSLLVADRFTVGITANYITGAEIMRKVAEAMDLKKLASLK